MRPHTPRFILNWWNGRPADEVKSNRRRNALPHSLSERARTDAQLAIDRAELRHNNNHATRKWWTTHVGVPAGFLSAITGLIVVTAKAEQDANNIVRHDSAQLRSAQTTQSARPVTTPTPKISPSAMATAIPTADNATAILVSPLKGHPPLSAGTKYDASCGPTIDIVKDDITFSIQLSGDQAATGFKGPITLDVLAYSNDHQTPPSEVTGPLRVSIGGKPWTVVPQSASQSDVASDWQDYRHGKTGLGLLASLTLTHALSEGTHNETLGLQFPLKGGRIITAFAELGFSEVDGRTTLSISAAGNGPGGLTTSSNNFGIGQGC
jgi:hypothetical protein